MKLMYGLWNINRPVYLLINDAQQTAENARIGARKPRKRVRRKRRRR